MAGGLLQLPPHLLQLLGVLLGEPLPPGPLAPEVLAAGGAGVHPLVAAPAQEVVLRAPEDGGGALIEADCALRWLLR